MDRFMPDAGKAERIQVMQDTALKVEETKMYVPLTREEMDVKRERQ